MSIGKQSDDDGGHLQCRFYISNNAKVKDIIDLIHKVLLAYTIQSAALLEKDLGKMIMSGDFNINFNTDEAQPLLRFLDEKFKLKLNTDKGQSTDQALPSTQYSLVIQNIFRIFTV